MKQMINILTLFCFLFITESKSQSCLECSISELREEVIHVDGFFDVKVENNINGNQYYTSKKKFPVERIWEVNNDTVRAYTIIINRDTEVYINSISQELTKKYNKVNNYLWVILDEQIQIELHELEGTWFYLYTKL